MKKVFVSWLVPTCLIVDDDLVASTAFFQIEVLQTVLNVKNYTIITITEVSAQVRFLRLVGEKKLLEQINAIVSHEMRNPLNSILAMVSKLKFERE